MRLNQPNKMYWPVPVPIQRSTTATCVFLAVFVCVFASVCVLDLSKWTDRIGMAWTISAATLVRLFTIHVFMCLFVSVWVFVCSTVHRMAYHRCQSRFTQAFTEPHTTAVRPIAFSSHSECRSSQTFNFFDGLWISFDRMFSVRCLTILKTLHFLFIAELQSFYFNWWFGGLVISWWLVIARALSRFNFQLEKRKQSSDS